MRRIATLLLTVSIACVLFTGCPPRDEADRAVPEERTMQMEARAFSDDAAVTTPGLAPLREGIVAADPNILPPGSRVRITDAGNYDGVYVVEDTSRRVEGRQIEIFVPDRAEAADFGTRTVQVEILDRGEPHQDWHTPQPQGEGQRY
jgi:3D (Asp-Asp-Asp) domain-containing protein